MVTDLLVLGQMCWLVFPLGRIDPDQSPRRTGRGTDGELDLVLAPMRATTCRVIG